MSSARHKDDHFKELLLDLKPYAKLLPKDSDVRQRVTLWVKKLMCSSDQKDRRNEYCKLLLQMLEDGDVTGVFREIPTDGPLSDLRMSLRPKSAKSSPSLKQSHLLQPGWAKNSLPLKHSPNYNEKYVQVPKFKEIRNEDVLESGGQSPPSLSLEELIGASNVFATSKGPPTLHAGRTRVDERRKMSFDTDSSSDDLQGLEYDFKISSPPSWHSGGDEDSDSDVTALLLQGDADAKDLDEDMEFLKTQNFHSSTPNNPSHTMTRQSVEKNRHTTPDRPANTFKPSPSQGSPGKHSSNATSPMKMSSSYSSYHRSPSLLHTQSIGAEAGIGLSGSKFYEERAKMQQKLEQTIRQLLDRKNNELEDIKSANRVQVHKMEAQIKSLERQVNHLQRECAHLQGELQRQEEDRSLSYQQQKISMQNEVQQQLVDSREAFEQEKLALQQKHTHQMQKILEESASQMTRLEDTYKSQLGTSTAVIEELEIRVGETMKQENANSEAYSRLAQEKVSLEGTLESIRHEILIKNDRLHQLEEENAALEREKRDALECQQRRHEEAVVQLRKQMKQQENQWSKRMKEAEKKLSTCSESKEERERMYKKELTELEILSKRKLQEERRKYVQKIQTLEGEMKQQEQDASVQVKKLEHKVREQSSRMEELRSSQRAKVQQAERALKEYRNQSESKANKTISEFRHKIEALEVELAQVQTKMATQKDVMTRQTQDQQKFHAREMEQVQSRHQQVLSQLNRDHQGQLERLNSQHKHDKDSLEKDLLYQLEKKERQWKDQIKDFLRENESLEAQVQQLTDEAHEVKVLSQKELADSAVKWEEDRLEMLQQQEAMVAKVRLQCEEQQAREKKTHTEEMARLREKASCRLKNAEAQYSSRIARVTECMEKYKEQTSSLEAELHRISELHERRITEINAHHQEEMRSFKAHNKVLNETAQQEAESAQKALRKLESKLEEVKLQHSEKMSHLKLSYEARMHGLLPQSVQKDLESTISSLREQVKVANKRTSLLQQELSTCTLSSSVNHSLSFNSAKTPTK